MHPTMSHTNPRSDRTPWRSALGRSALAISIALLGTALPAGCTGGGSKSWAAKGDRGRAESLLVDVTAVEPTSIERHYETSGTLQALRAAQIVAVQTGIIKKLRVEEGDRVEANQTLAVLDGRELKLQASQASLQVTNLARELERMESISTLDAISREEIAKQRYAVEEARAAAKLSRHQASQTTVRAPFAGTITRRHVDAGNLATSASPLFDLADTSALELELYLPEKEASGVRVDAAVELELLDGTAFKGTVIRRAPVVDELTGTVKFTVRATEAPESAMPGAFVRARVLVGKRDNAPSLPRSSVFDVEGETFVYVIEEGKARRKAVKLGLEGRHRIEVMDGVTPDDVIVQQGNDGITEGMPVRAPGDEPAADNAEEGQGEGKGEGKRGRGKRRRGS